MYLSAREIPKTSLLTEWKGKKGKFVRTFAIDTTRNKNKWRVTWDSIVNNIGTAIGYPGIEFMNCESGECDLDHVEAETFKGLVEKQKPYKRATTIDYVLDEANQSADTIDEVHDDEFWEKLKSGEIKYVSPLIWPYTGGYEVIGVDDITGNKIIDAWDWHWVHKAYLTKDPAFGVEKANIKAMCEGDNCQMQMLSAKALIDVSLYNKTSPQKEFPMIVKHKEHLHYLSASKKVQEIITKKIKDGKIDDNTIVQAYSEAGESNKAKSSFKTCTCDTRQLKMSTEENKVKDLEAKLKGAEDKTKELEAKLKGAEDEKNDDNLKAKLKARFSAMFKGMSEEERENMKAKLKAVEDEENMKAMDEVHKEMKAKEDGEGNDTTITKLKARVGKMEKFNLPNYIDGLIALKASTGVDQKVLREYHTALLAKSFSDVETLYSNDEIIIKGLPAKSVQSTEARFEMADDITALKGKSSEEIIMEALN